MHMIMNCKHFARLWVQVARRIFQHVMAPAKMSVRLRSKAHTESAGRGKGGWAQDICSWRKSRSRRCCCLRCRDTRYSCSLGVCWSDGNHGWHQGQPRGGSRGPLHRTSPLSRQWILFCLSMLSKIQGRISMWICTKPSQWNSQQKAYFCTLHFCTQPDDCIPWTGIIAMLPSESQPAVNFAVLRVCGSRCELA